MRKVLFILFWISIVPVAVHAGTVHIDEFLSAQDHEKKIEIKGVKGVDISIGCALYIRQGNREALKIEAEEDIFHFLKVEVRDSILYIDSEKREHDIDDLDVEVYLSVKSLNYIDIGGAVKLETVGILKTGRLEIDVSGAADIEMQIDAEKLLADFSGAVNADIKGKARYVVMDMSGASNVDADDLITDAFYLDFSGFGKAGIYTEKVLKVDMSGMGVVKYGGNPDKVESNVSGLGIIKPR
jgi:hypothetical protein